MTTTSICTAAEWPKAVSDIYEPVHYLGKGGFACVLLGKSKKPTPNGEDAYVAIKRIQSPFDQEVDAVRLFREIHILRRLKGHDCVIDLLDVVQPPTDDLDDFHDLYLVFECTYLLPYHLLSWIYRMTAEKQ